MKILLLSPWENVWVEYFRKYFESMGYEFSYEKSVDSKATQNYDIILCGWADGNAEFLGALPKLAKKYICFLRSYEYYHGQYKKVKWDNFDHIVFCNEHIRKKVDLPRSSVIPNAIDLEKIVFFDKPRERTVLFLADLNFKKGLMLLSQIVLKLPNYKFYIAGNVQDQRFLDYLQDRDFKNLFYMGYVNDINDAFKQCSHILCTSPAEGHPNNIIEGMASGLKPIIHRYLGVKGQFPDEYIFDSVDEAVEMITGGDCEPEKYREFVKRYDYREVYKKIEELF